MTAIPPFIFSEVSSRLARGPAAELFAADVAGDAPEVAAELADLLVVTYCRGFAAGYNAFQFEEDEELAWEIADWLARSASREPCPACARPFACADPENCIRAK